MLFKHCTWQQFLVAATILTAVWYAVVILIFYRKRAWDILKSKQQPEIQGGPLKHAWEDDYEEMPADEEDDLIGKSVLPEGMTRVSMNMFGFAPKLAAGTSAPDQENEGILRDNQPESDDSRQMQQGLVPDVMEELKKIFYILENDQGGKEQLMSLFGMLKNKYGAIRHTPSESAINEFIRANVLFPISDDELQNLWN